MAPDFEIFWKLEIMRMISFFLPDLRLSAVGTPELRIADADNARVDKCMGVYQDRRMNLSTRALSASEEAC